MRKFNKYNKVVGLAMAALAFTACSDDWDDHYNVQSQLQGDGTLWQALMADDNLKNFRDVLEVCGYDSILNGGQAFTLFAPTNENLSAEKAQEWIDTYTAEKARRVQDEDNTTIKKFVRNHIALYNHSVSGNSDNTIQLMNGKYCSLKTNSVGGKELVSKNRKHTNGVLFTLKEPIAFSANVYEKLFETSGLDSLAEFFRAYEKYEFLPGSSVPGEIVDGKTEYLDSVFWFENTLFSELCYNGSEKQRNEYGSYRTSSSSESLDLADEDSTYWIVAPTNSVWETLVEEYSQYFVYPTNIEKHDSLSWMMPRMAIVDGSIFTRYRNVEAFDGDENVEWVTSTSAGVLPELGRFEKYGLIEDKLCRYYEYPSPFGADGIFSGTERIESSNGVVWKTDDWKIDKSMTFCQRILIEGENTQTQVPDTAQKSPTLPLNNIKVNAENVPFYISGDSYVEIAPKATTNPSASFYIDNVLSGVPYDIYAVFVPASVDTLATADQKRKNVVRFDLHWVDPTDPNKTPYERLINKEEVDYDSDGDGNEGVQAMLLTDEDGWIFPYCTKGLGTDSRQIWLTLEGRAGSKNSKTMRLDCIILEPHTGTFLESGIEGLRWERLITPNIK